MEDLECKNWCTGSNQSIDFFDIVNLLQKHTLSGAKIFIGSDSFVQNKKICFTSAICLHGSDLGSRYFFFREHVKKNQFLTLAPRITEEVRRSIEIACTLVDDFQFNTNKIELHMDVSPTHAGEATSKLSDMLKGYVRGFGIGCKIKPNAWASQSIADRHSK